MQSNGGVATPAEISERAALSLLSGPASGPTAGLWQLAPHGLRDCITMDMGGTSFDVALVSGGEPLLMVDGVVDRWRLALPTIDIHTIGAGGGSIAWLDTGGLLHVGPQSAGAQPGPACYGRGGTQPTVTDADLVLGYLGEESFEHAGMRLDRGLAVRALEPLAAALGLGVEEAAAGVYDLANVTMATGVRDASVRRGLEPRDFPLVVAGGAGPLHAAAIARELDVGALLVPRESSIFCAAGMLLSDFKHDHVRAYKSPLAGSDPVRLRTLFEEMSASGRDTLSREGMTGEAVELRAALDLRYIGQWHELTVAVELPLDVDAAAAAFHAEHDRLFGHASPGAPVEVLALRLGAVGRTEKPELVSAPDDLEADARRGERPGVGPRRARVRDGAGVGRPEAGGLLDAERPGDRRALEHHDRGSAGLHARSRRLRGVRGAQREPRRRVRAPARRRGGPLSAPPLLRLTGITKRFPGVVALDERGPHAPRRRRFTRSRARTGRASRRSRASPPARWLPTPAASRSTARSGRSARRRRRSSSASCRSARSSRWPRR